MQCIIHNAKCIIKRYLESKISLKEHNDNYELIIMNYELKWGCSSAGRASALHAEGQEFDPPHLHHKGRIAQVVRAHA